MMYIGPLFSLLLTAYSSLGYPLSGHPGSDSVYSLTALISFLPKLSWWGIEIVWEVSEAPSSLFISEVMLLLFILAGRFV